MQYQLKRSRRKTVAIKVAAAEVVVHAPLRMPEATISRFVLSKQAWIERHLQRQQQILQALPARQWQLSERWRWLGQPLQLQWLRHGRPQLQRQQQRLWVTLSAQRPIEGQLQRLLPRWYQQQAQHWLDQFFAAWPASHPLQPRSWAVANFRSKWGHCSRQGELKFSWRLFMAPEWVVRDVVLHELCHLQQFNHSAQFWQLLAQYAPEHEKSDRWLRQHGLTLLNDRYLDFAEQTPDCA